MNICILILEVFWFFYVAHLPPVLGYTKRYPDEVSGTKLFLLVTVVDKETGDFSVSLEE